MWKHLREIFLLKIFVLYILFLMSLAKSEQLTMKIHGHYLDVLSSL